MPWGGRGTLLQRREVYLKIEKHKRITRPKTEWIRWRERESSTQNLQFSPSGLCTRGIPTNHQNSDLGAALSSFNQNSPLTEGGRGQATPQGQTPCSVAKVSQPKHELGGGCERNEWEENSSGAAGAAVQRPLGWGGTIPAQGFPSRLQWQKTERDFIECCHLLVLKSGETLGLALAQALLSLQVSEGWRAQTKPSPRSRF